VEYIHWLMNNVWTSQNPQVQASVVEYKRAAAATTDVQVQ